MKDFVAISDYSPQEIQDMLDLAVWLKQEWKAGGNLPLFKGKVLAVIFQKPSQYTRVSFEMAMRQISIDRVWNSELFTP